MNRPFKRSWVARHFDWLYGGMKTQRGVGCKLRSEAFQVISGWWLNPLWISFVKWPAELHRQEAHCRPHLGLSNFSNLNLSVFRYCFVKLKWGALDAFVWKDEHWLSQLTNLLQFDQSINRCIVAALFTDVQQTCAGWADFWTLLTGPDKCNRKKNNGTAH